MRVWRNWQTRMIQVHIFERKCRFNSCYPHHAQSLCLCGFGRFSLFKNLTENTCHTPKTGAQLYAVRLPNFYMSTGVGFTSQSYSPNSENTIPRHLCRLYRRFHRSIIISPPHIRNKIFHLFPFFLWIFTEICC